MPDDMPVSRAVARATRRAASHHALLAGMFVGVLLFSFAAPAGADAPPTAGIGAPFLTAPGDLIDPDETVPAVAATSAVKQVSRSQARRARSAGRTMMRLVNRMRARRGLRRIRSSRRIRAAASAYAAEMTRLNFFSHVGAGGTTPADRLARVGYSRVKVGEVLAWGCGAAARPTAILRSWINSPPHYAVLTDRAWKVAGVGIASGVPGNACAGRTWSMSFAGG